MKNVTDFHKTVETGVDPHLQYRIKAPYFNVSKERIHLFLSAIGRGECNGPCAPVAPPPSLRAWKFVVIGHAFFPKQQI